MKWKLPPHVDSFIEKKSGKTYFYYRNKRAGGPRIRLPGIPGTPEFMAAYEDARAVSVVPGARVVTAGSIDAAVLAYFEDDMWQNELSDGSRNFRRPILEGLRSKYGTAKVRVFKRHHVQDIIANRPPSAQLNWMKTLRHFFKWCLRENKLECNPCDDIITKVKPKTGGWRPWTEDDVATFRAFYPIGTMPRLAMEMMLNLGIRVSDVIQIGRRDIRDGFLADYQPQKGRRTGGLRIHVPVNDELERVIAGTPTIGIKTFLVAARGGAFDAEYFGFMMRKWCNAAKLPQCSSHGLRKLCLTRLADSGCTPFEVMAISGHKNLKEVTIYTEAANRKKLALLAMAKLNGKTLDASLSYDKLAAQFAAMQAAGKRG